MYKISQTKNSVDCVAGIVVNPQGQLLLLHRLASRANEPDCWSVVSGHAQKEETPLQAVCREINEEIGIEVSIPVVVGSIMVVNGERIQPFLFLITQQQAENLVVDPVEHDAWQWIELADMPSFKTVVALWTDLQLVQLRPSRTIIGVVGKNGAGKDTVADYLATEYGFVKLHLSDFVKAEAVRRNIVMSRRNLHRLSQEILEAEGQQALSDRTIKLIEKHNWTKVVVCGIRTPDNIQSFENFYNQAEVKHQKKMFQLWSVKVSSAKERFARMLVRESARDPKTWQDFLNQEQQEERLFKISQTEKKADLVLQNDTTVEELCQSVDESIRHLFGGTPLTAQLVE